MITLSCLCVCNRTLCTVQLSFAFPLYILYTNVLSVPDHVPSPCTLLYYCTVNTVHPMCTPVLVWNTLLLIYCIVRTSSHMCIFLLIIYLNNSFDVIRRFIFAFKTFRILKGSLTSPLQVSKSRHPIPTMT